MCMLIGAYNCKCVCIYGNVNILTYLSIILSLFYCRATYFDFNI